MKSLVKKKFSLRGRLASLSTYENNYYFHTFSDWDFERHYYINKGVIIDTLLSEFFSKNDYAILKVNNKIKYTRLVNGKKYINFNPSDFEKLHNYLKETFWKDIDGEGYLVVFREQKALTAFNLCNVNGVIEKELSKLYI